MPSFSRAVSRHCLFFLSIVAVVPQSRSLYKLVHSQVLLLIKSSCVELIPLPFEVNGKSPIDFNDTRSSPFIGISDLFTAGQQRHRSEP